MKEKSTPTAKNASALLIELRTAPRKHTSTGYGDGDSILTRSSTFDAFGRTNFEKAADFDPAADLHADARKQGGILKAGLQNALMGKTVAPSQARAIAGFDLDRLKDMLAGEKPTAQRVAAILRTLDI